MVFCQPQRDVVIPTLHIDNVMIECVNEFAFLGLTLDTHLSWNNHIQKIASKISQTIGIMNKLKVFLPSDILQIIYNSLILPRFNYCLLSWGHKLERLEKLQKKAVRIINHSKYNAHSEPILKSRNLLKLEDIYILQALKFYYKLLHGLLPSYFHQHLQITSTPLIHDHDTRRPGFFVFRTQHTFARKCLRHELTRILNLTPDIIKDKVHTHSFFGFSQYIKKYFIENYEISCSVPNCYICNEN